MKKLALILILLLCLTGCDKSNDEPLNVSVNETQVNENVSAEIEETNLEAELLEPDDSNKVIESSDPGDVVANIDAFEEKVVLNVEENKAPHDTVSGELVNNRIQVSVEMLDIHTHASMDSEVIDSVYLGSVYIVHKIEYDENISPWLQINISEDKTGWISARYCTETTFNEVVRVEGEYELLNIPLDAYVDTTINISELLGDSGYIVTVNDEEIVGDYKFSRVGVHEFISRKKDDSSEGVLYLTQAHEKSAYGMINESYNIDSRVIGVIHRGAELTDTINQVIMLYNDGVEIWYEVKLEGDRMGYLLRTDEKTYDYIINKVTWIVNDKSMTYEGENLEANRLLYFDKYLKIDIDWQTHKLINSENGNVFETDYNMYLLNDDESMVIYKTIHQGLYNQQELTEFEIIDLSSDNFDVVFKSEKPLIYVKSIYDDGYIEFVDDNTFYVGSQSIEPWYYADNLVLEELCQFNKINDTWTLKVLESPLDNLVDETLTIYSEFLNLNSNIGAYKVSDCEEIKFMRIYDIIDMDYVLWYEVTLKDGQKGYTYRNKRSYESEGILTSTSFDLVLSDNTLEHIEGSSAQGRAFKVLESGLESVRQYMISSMYEGKWTIYVSKDEGRIEEGHMDTYHYTSKDNTIVVRNTEGFHDPSVEFTIFDTRNGDLNELYYFEQMGIYFNKINIIDNETITLWINDYRSNKYPVVMRFINDHWAVETDYKFD